MMTAALILASALVEQPLRIEAPFTFSYGAREKSAAVGSGFIELGERATPRGGAGFNAAFSADPDWTPVLTLQARPGNQMKEIRLLVKSGEHDATFHFTVPDPGPAQEVFAKQGASLARPNEDNGKPKASTGPNQWQLIGDWSGDGPARVRISGIRFAPPSAAAIAARAQRSQADQQAQAARQAEQERLRGLYGSRTELSPKITELSFIGEDALNVAIQAGRVELAPMRPYQPEPGDQKVTENNGNTVKLVRGGQEIGWLVGPNRATLKPYEKLIGDPLLDEFAADPAQFTLTSDADPNYRTAVAARRLERKSKPNDAAQPSFDMAMLHRL